MKPASHRDRGVSERSSTDSPAAARAQQLYDDLLADVGTRAPLLTEGLVVAHWPHVGSAYAGLVIVGQALHGWMDDFDPSAFQIAEKRAEALEGIRRRGSEQTEPMAWLATSPVRGSPF